jgi:hypothetical protein
MRIALPGSTSFTLHAAPLAIPPGARLVRVVAREHVYPGDTLRVRVVTEAAEPQGFEGVLVNFGDQERRTDAKGHVEFTVPEVRFPTTFYMTAEGAGVVQGSPDPHEPGQFYWPSHLAVTAHLPPGVMYSMPPTLKERLRRVTIVKVGGRIAKIAPLSTGAIEDKLKDAKVPLGMPGGNDEPITPEDLCEKMRADPPDVLIISGCGSDELLTALAGCGPRLVIGYDRTVAELEAARATEALLEGLLDGEKTIQVLLGEASTKARDQWHPHVTAIGRQPQGGLDLGTAKLADALRKRESELAIRSNAAGVSAVDPQEYSVAASARLTDKVTGSPLAGRWVMFKVLRRYDNVAGDARSELIAQKTDGNGVASVQKYFTRMGPGNRMEYRLDAEFEGDEGYGPSSAGASWRYAE